VVARATIKRLAGQIDALKQLYQAQREFKTVFVTCEYDETSANAWERHIADHPEDADADVAITRLHYDGYRHRAKETSDAENLRAVGQGGRILT
jgi:hypothetical protein